MFSEKAPRVGAAGGRSRLLLYQSHIIFNGAAGLFKLWHQGVRVFGCYAQLPGGEGDGGGFYFRHGLYLAFHLGCTIGTVEALYDIYPLPPCGNIVEIMVVAMIVAAVAVVAMVMAASACVMIVVVMMVAAVVMTAATAFIVMM